MNKIATSIQTPANSVQVGFLAQVKAQTKSPLTFIDELAGLLEISPNSAYRRISGKTTMSVDELMLVSKHYGVPFSTHNNFSNDMLMFKYSKLSEHDGAVKEYLQVMLKTFQQINSAKNKEILILASEMPPFYYFRFPEISLFKFFYHKRAILNDEYLSNKLFDISLIDADLVRLCKDIHAEFIKIPTMEIWHDTTIDGTLGQIEYFWDSGVFAKKKDVLVILNQLLSLLDDLKLMAGRNSKILPTQENNFVLYQSDIMLGNTTYNVNLDMGKMAFLRFNLFNSLTTTNIEFCNEAESWFKCVIKKSTKISGTAEKQRNKFFKLLYEKIKRLTDRIAQD